MEKKSNKYEKSHKGKKGVYISIISSFMLLIIGIVDYLTKSELSFPIFYIVPVALAAWHNMLFLGIIFSVCSAFFWLIANLISNHYYVHPIIPFLNALIKLGFFLIVNYVLIILKKSLEREKELSRMDMLTGLYNTRGFYEFAAHEMNRSMRYKHPFTMAYIDVDKFQSINDIHGYSTGDSVLRLIAATIRNNLRKSDICARLGGDEYGILFPETDHDAVKVIFNRIHKNLSDFLRNIGYPLTFSIGVSTFVSTPHSTDEIIKYASNLMLSAKNTGKNSIIFDIYNK